MSLLEVRLSCRRVSSSVSYFTLDLHDCSCVICYLKMHHLNSAFLCDLWNCLLTSVVCSDVTLILCHSECSINCYYQIDVHDNGLSVTGDMRALMV